MFDINKTRSEFPPLRNAVLGKLPIYMDSACMAMKPESVILAMDRYYREYPACGERSIHHWGERVTKEVDETRLLVARFIGARKASEVVFTRNTTEAINLLANSFPFKAGDVVLTTNKEHNSNLIPWQMLARTRGVKHKVLPMNEDGSFPIEQFRRDVVGVRLVSLGITSNWDGMRLDGKEIAKIAHEAGAMVHFDAAQTVPHENINVQSIGTDFLSVSGHKMYGPTGTGFLFAKEEMMHELTSFMVGGGTVADVSLESHILLDAPERFEAGLQDYAGIIGLGAAVKWLSSIDREAVKEHEELLAKKLRDGLAEFSGVKMFGDGRGAIVSFLHEKLDPERVAVMLEEVGGIMVRSGRHCNHLWAETVGAKKGTVRASLAMYNTEEEIECFVDTMKKIVTLV